MRRALLTTLLLSTLSGCGTLGSLTSEEGNKVYGGVRVDGAMMGLLGNEDAAELEGMWLIGVLDLPFSLIADTLILPYTLFTVGSAPAQDKPAK